ncbi:deoxyribonuclease [Vibrio tubiashii]|nr:deoxyribonuclease [Vibrio tubiashii]
MRLFDTHCHLDFDSFAPRLEPHIEAAKSSGVERFVIPSIGPSNWQRIERLSQMHPSVYYALGIHPQFLDSVDQTSLKQLEKILTQSVDKCVAVGECGLDAAAHFGSNLQEQIFTRQVEFAMACQLPLIMHSRKTHHRLLQLLKQYRFPYGGVLHGFSGSYQQAMQFVDLGFHIGVGGVITYPRANKTRQAVAKIPLESIVLETDSPDMPLSGYQGEANHPKRLPQILECLALLKDTSRQTVAEIVWNSSNSAFGICE